MEPLYKGQVGTVEPLYKGQVGSFVGCPLLRGNKCTITMGSRIFGIQLVLCSEVVLFQSVHYWRFHCIVYVLKKLLISSYPIVEFWQAHWGHNLYWRSMSMLLFLLPLYMLSQLPNL